jgi:hypothetical protein
MILVVSNRFEDIQFTKLVAQHVQLPHEVITSIQDLKKFLKSEPNAFVFWDIDYSHATHVAHPLSVSKVNEVLGFLTSYERIFVISDHHLNSMPYVFSISTFNHHIYRRYGGSAYKVIGCLVQAIHQQILFKIEQFLPVGMGIKTIQLTHSAERRALVEAVNGVMDSYHIPARFSNRIAQAVDELLMNAIFDAPYSQGKYYRMPIERSAAFKMTEKEQVTLSFGLSERYGCICVHDQFGSLKRNVILKFMKINYSKNTYKFNSAIPSAGLGNYGILQSGLSVIYASREDVGTSIYLLFPLHENMRAIKNAFRFVSIL